MLMKSDIKGFVVEFQTGDKVGKLEDLVVDTTKERWEVVGLRVAPGLVHRDIMVVPTQDVEIDIAEEETIVITGQAALEKPITHAASKVKMDLDFLDNLPVITADGEKIGKVYDIVVLERVKPWKVWKLLVKQKGLRKRRLRMDVRDIGNVTDEGIELKLKLAEIEEIEQETDTIEV
jgi:uncharacterized protein YrrD